MPKLPIALAEELESLGTTMGPPEGYKGIRGRVPTEVVDAAKRILAGTGKSKDYWYGYYETMSHQSGKEYLIKVEPHYDNHPRGFKGDPFWHPGVSVYELKES